MKPLPETFMSDMAGRIAIMSGVATAAWGFIQDNLLGIVGVLVTVATYFMNKYYKRRDAERREIELTQHTEYHNLRMQERGIRLRILGQVEEANRRRLEYGALEGVESGPAFVDTATVPAPLEPEDDN